jgi:hypothetical protein
MTPQEMFVTRMRRHRERSRISLTEIAAETRIKSELLEAFEQNDLRGWPRGLYARAWVRAYASAIGYDPIDTVDEFCRLFPHGDRRAAGTMTGIAAIVASPAGYRDEFSHEEDRRRAPGTRINVLHKPGARDQMVRIARTIRALLVEIPLFHRAQYRERQ